MTQTISKIGDKTTRKGLDALGATFRKSRGATFAVVRAERIGADEELLAVLDEGGEALVIARQPPGDAFAKFLRHPHFVQDAIMQAEAEASGVGPIMRDAGYGPHDTGGGCKGWLRTLDGDQFRDYLLITSEDLELSGDRAAQVWAVGRYVRGHVVGEDEAWICVDGLTLEEAIDTADRVPRPVATDETSVTGLDELHALIADREAAVAAPAPAMG